MSNRFFKSNSSILLVSSVLITVVVIVQFEKKIFNAVLWPRKFKNVKTDVHNFVVENHEF